MISVQLYSKLLGHENIISFGYCFIQFMGTRCRPSEDRYDKKDLANREFAYVYTYISNEYALK